VAVATGAFGAHGLRAWVTPERLAVWHTAVLYHLVHALGLLALGLLALQLGEFTGSLRWAAWCLLAGIILFSGSLYALVLTDTPWLGAIAPVGGVAFILGWLLLAWTAWSKFV